MDGIPRTLIFVAFSGLIRTDNLRHIEIKQGSISYVLIKKGRAILPGPQYQMLP